MADNDRKKKLRATIFSILGIFFIIRIITLGEMLASRGNDNLDNENSPNNFYSYNKTTSKGLTILATENVNQTAIDKAEYISNQILENPDIKYPPLKLIILKADMDITELPQYEFLLNWGNRTDGRVWRDFRSLGANRGNHYAVIDERNLLCDDPYQKIHREDLLIHELAHSFMEVLMSDDQRNLIEQMYNNSIKSGMYDPEKHYAGVNEGEYFAVSCTSYFNATSRKDTNNGIFTRGLLKESDPNLYDFMKLYFKSNWTYNQDILTKCD